MNSGYVYYKRLGVHAIRLYKKASPNDAISKSKLMGVYYFYKMKTYGQQKYADVKSTSIRSSATHGYFRHLSYKPNI